MIAKHILAAMFVVVVIGCAGSASAVPIEGFAPDPFGAEQSRTSFLEDGSVRVVVTAPRAIDPAKPTLLILFALPNGNTIEQTIGCGAAPGLDWHFDIQHVAAQVRRAREQEAGRNVVVAYAEADTLSWPAWRQQRPDAPRRVAGIVAALAESLPGRPPAVALTCHSGGGAFLFSFLDAADAVPPAVERFVFLDANYSFDADKGHGKKLAAWVGGDPSRQLVVVAYDDRNVTINGKKVVSDTGGTWRASERMLASLAAEHAAGPAAAVPAFDEARDGDVVRRTGFGGRARFLLHTNPQTKILHTVLVERNGLLAAMAAGTAWDGRWGGTFYGDRAYAGLVQPLPAVPARPPTAASGAAVAARLDPLPPDRREAAVVAEATRGNVPDFLRRLKPVVLRAEVDGRAVACTVDVAADYFAVGGDDDFVRVPLTPAAAMRLAAQLGCTLPTRKMVDAIDAAAEVALEPRPLTEAREAFATFVRHNAIIEAQRQGRRGGRTGIVTGVKKDVVVSNRLLEKPGRVAIYGWRKPDGQPIQPLTTVHQAHYVDYSHGARLVGRAVRVDGRERMIEDVLADPRLHVLLSDEGPITAPAARYQAAAEPGPPR